MVDFRADWYERFVRASNEKMVIVNAVSNLLKDVASTSCLEIGLGTHPIFAEVLAKRFKTYDIIERENVTAPLPENARVICDDFEERDLHRSYDAIIASHVIYYFKDKPSAVEKILSHVAPNGLAVFVVNGLEPDYGPLKLAFSQMTGTPYHPTYEALRGILGKRIKAEHVVKTELQSSSFEELFELLRLSFDAQPQEYHDQKRNVLSYLQAHVAPGRFSIQQKILLAQ